MEHEYHTDLETTRLGLDLAQVVGALYFEAFSTMPFIVAHFAVFIRPDYMISTSVMLSPILLTSANILSAYDSMVSRIKSLAIV